MAPSGEEQARLFYGILTEILNISWGTGPNESKYTSYFIPVDGARVCLTAGDSVSGGSVPLKVQYERQTAWQLVPTLRPRYQAETGWLPDFKYTVCRHASSHPFILKKR